MNYNVYEWGGVCLRERSKKIDDGFLSNGITNFDKVSIREPVIYIENFENETIELDVDISPLGSITETYPNYSKAGDWEIKVSPDGYINEVLPYLFYEVDVDLKECLDSMNSFDVAHVTKSEFWDYIKSVFDEKGFHDKHFQHFVQYWSRYIDKYEDGLSVSTFKDHLVQKYFHTVFSPEQPIYWKRLYFAFWSE